MLSIAHSLTGAFLATKLGSPFLFVPLTFASHYLEDWIPHWDVGTGLSSGKRKRSTAILLEFGDLFISAALIWFFWKDSPLQVQFLAAVGGIVGLVPDFLEAPRNFLKWEPFWMKPFNEFHGKFHHSTHHKWFGLIPQIGLIALLYFLR